MISLTERIETIVAEAVPDKNAGVALGVMQDGEIVETYTRGYANRRLETPFTTRTCFRICSVTKHLTCFLILKAEQEGILSLNDHPARYLPQSESLHKDLKIFHLCTNQSGLKDYWCAAMLMGAKPESQFTRGDADALFPLLSEQDSAPGAEFRYCNTNFMILGRILETVYKRGFGELLNDEIFTPLDIADSFCGANTGKPMPDGATGYETLRDDPTTQAVTNIFWEGDAGVVSTLKDLLKWERVFHDAESPLHETASALTQTACFASGAPAPYRFGLRVAKRRETIEHIHLGALRGWRMARLYSPSEQTSVLLLMNNMTEPAPLARAIMDTVLNRQPQQARNPPAHKTKKEPVFYRNHQHGLLAQVESTGDDLKIDIGGRVFIAHQKADKVYTNLDQNGETTEIKFRDKTALMTLSLPEENTFLSFKALGFHDPVQSRPKICGQYQYAEGLSVATISQIHHGSFLIQFEGYLGLSEMYNLHHAGEACAYYRCERALDFAPPGIFCVNFDYAPSEEVTALRISCWHARNIIFRSLK